MGNHLIPPIREAFPLLRREGPNGRPLVYLDSAATALKPQAVIDAVAETLSDHSASVHRSVHLLGDEATERYERARGTVARFINAEAHEIIFVRNTTEALNLVARSWPRKGRVITSLGEHHSNLLPWTDHVTRLRPGLTGTLDLDALDRELQKGDVSLVSVAHVGNVTGAKVDIAELAVRVHVAGAVLVVDGAQSVPHSPIDVAELGCDFLAFSGHKMCGPSGVGVLYGKGERLAELDWFLRGGSTVESFRGGVPAPKAPPWRFEAGTPAVESAVGLAAAIDFLESVGMDVIERHERALVRHALEALRTRLPAAGLVGPNDSRRVGPVSFTLPGISPHQLARGLSDGHGILVRSGFHCAQPLHESLGVNATLRLSFYLYNTPAEIDLALDVLTELASLHRGR